MKVKKRAQEYRRDIRCNEYSVEKQGEHGRQTTVSSYRLTGVTAPVCCCSGSVPDDPLTSCPWMTEKYHDMNILDIERAPGSTYLCV